MKKIKSNKGITLLALSIYILIFTLIIGVMITIISFFYGNINNLVDTPKYAQEFNKFIMFFATDIKNYEQATVTDTTIQFENGPSYKYENNSIYRNDTAIANNIFKCIFTLKQYSVNEIIKNIINVDLQIGNDDEKLVREQIDFTLKYW